MHLIKRASPIIRCLTAFLGIQPVFCAAVAGSCHLKDAMTGIYLLYALEVPNPEPLGLLHERRHDVDGCITLCHVHVQSTHVKLLFMVLFLIAFYLAAHMQVATHKYSLF